jgi:hypothetical protein
MKKPKLTAYDREIIKDCAFILSVFVLAMVIIAIAPAIAAGIFLGLIAGGLALLWASGLVVWWQDRN